MCCVRSCRIQKCARLWSYIKIKTLRDRTPTKIFNSLQEARGEGNMNHSTISRRAAKLKKNRKSTEDGLCSGRLRMSTDATNASIITSINDKERRLTLQEIVREVNISTVSVKVRPHLHANTNEARHARTDEHEAKCCCSSSQ